MNPKLSKALYRSLLRASQNGRHPQVFGHHGAAVFEAQVQGNKGPTSLALPNQPSQVRQRLKEFWRNPSPEKLSQESPFAILELVHQQESLLPNSTGPTPGKILPIFDYDGVAALPGEITQMVFLTPRNLVLAASLMEGDGHFLLRSSPKSSSATLVQMLSHMVLPTNMVVVACRGGARVNIKEEITEEVPGQIDPVLAAKYKIDAQEAKELSMATNYEWKLDTSMHPEFILAEKRQHILDMLYIALPMQDSSLLKTLSQFGLPPLEAEAFSFWALRYVLAPDDVQSRNFWLQTTHTADRMDYVISELESILTQDSVKETEPEFEEQQMAYAGFA